MNRIEQPPTSTTVIGRDADDIDVLLRRYFQAEMPSPWPMPVRRVLPFPKAQRPARTWISRMTLAASVACLLTGSVWFASRSTTAAPTTSAPQEARKRSELHRPIPDPLALPDQKPPRR
jgi:hypothetical protein